MVVGELGEGGGGDAVRHQGVMVVHHGCSGPVGLGISDGSPDEGFAVASEMSRGAVSVAVAAAFTNSSAALLPGMPLWPGTQMWVVGPSLFSSRWRKDWVSCAPL